MTNLKQKFYDITSLIQVEFDRNLELYGDKIQCRKGCSKCCSQIFHITLIDAYIIGEHIRTLPLKRREELQKKAREYLLHPPLSGGEKEHTAGMFREGVPCPALGAEGECTIYEARPVICRRFGMPVYDYKNPTNVHACELNFKDGDEITDELLVPNQTTIGMKWDELKEEFNAEQDIFNSDHPALRASLLGKEETKAVKIKGTTIAEAIAGA